MVRTRIAPSPTGFPHIGTVYQALFNFAFSRKHKGTFILRIEDTDRQRFVENAEEKIYEALDFFSLTEDESPRKEGRFGPYKQSERVGLYKKYAKDLVGNGYAYYCFCTKERLETLRKEQMQKKKPPMYDKHCLSLSKSEKEKKLSENKEYVIRLNVLKNKTVTFTDQVRGVISFDSNTIDDQVLLKSDGFPTYHLAVVVDDHLMEITHVVRGEEWITSTPKHVLLYEYFGWEKPLFFHTPILRNQDKSKLSKRHGHASVDWYKDQGFLPQAILNFLALMGWSHPGEKEVFSLDEFISLFELSALKAVGPIFDMQKLTWLNGVWIRNIYQANSHDLKKRLQDFYKNNSDVEKILRSQKADLYISASVTRMKTLKDFSLLIDDSFRTPTESEKNYASLFLKKIKDVEKPWSDDLLLEQMNSFKRQQGVSNKVLYYLLTGKDQGLPILELKNIHGEDYFLKKLETICNA